MILRKLKEAAEAHLGQSVTRAVITVPAVFEVKATSGDTHLGGDNFDQRVMDWIADEFRKGARHRPAGTGWRCSV